LGSNSCLQLPQLDNLTLSISRDAVDFYLSVMHNALSGTFNDQCHYRIISSDTYDETGGMTLLEGHVGDGAAATWENLITSLEIAPDVFLRVEFELTCPLLADTMQVGIDDVVFINAASGQGFIYSLIDKAWTPIDMQLSQTAYLRDGSLIGASLNKNASGYHEVVYGFKGNDLAGANLYGNITIGPSALGKKGKKLLSHIKLLCKQLGNYNVTITVTNEKGASVARVLNLAGSDANHEYTVLIGLGGEFFTIAVSDDSANPAFEVSDMTVYYKGGR